MLEQNVFCSNSVNVQCWGCNYCKNMYLQPNTVNLQCWNKIYFVPTLLIYSVGFFHNSGAFQSVVTNRRDVISLRHRTCDQRVPFAQRLPSCSLTCACTIRFISTPTNPFSVNSLGVQYFVHVCVQAQTKLSPLSVVASCPILQAGHGNRPSRSCCWRQLLCVFG